MFLDEFDHIIKISIHALREEGDGGSLTMLDSLSNFYPRPPRGGRHAGEALRVGGVVISIHALREEGDPSQISAARLPVNFYPRPPRGGRLYREVCYGV